MSDTYKEAIDAAFDSWLAGLSGQISLSLCEIHGISAASATAALKNAFTAGGVAALNQAEKLLHAH